MPLPSHVAGCVLLSQVYNSQLKGSDDSLRSSILDALCAGELWEGKPPPLDLPRLNRKLTDGYRPQRIERKGDRWHIQWKSPEMAKADLLNRTFGSPGYSR